jgi:hypothetical protein
LVGLGNLRFLQVNCIAPHPPSIYYILSSPTAAVVVFPPLARKLVGYASGGVDIGAANPAADARAQGDEAPHVCCAGRGCVEDGDNGGHHPLEDELLP